MRDVQVLTPKTPSTDTKIEPNLTIDDFLRDIDVKPASRETYRKAIRQFFTYLASNDIHQVKREDILNFKRALIEKHLSPFTVNTYIVAVRRFFDWLESKGAYINVARGIKGVRSGRGFKRDVLTVHQIKDLLSRIDRSTLQGKRDYALINLLIRTGLRTVEVMRADVKDIKQVGGEAVLYIQGKGRDDKDDFVILTPETLNPLREYLTERRARPDEPLFTSTSNRARGKRLTTRSIRGIVKRWLREIGIDDERITAHSLRHTAITLSLLAGATIQEAQRLARHSNINTTLIYAHNIDRIKHAPERKIDELLQGVM